MESKHGAIYATMSAEFHWEEVPWRIGEDFKAPTCATCHNALLVRPDGEVIAERTHDFGARLWVRISGLPYSHPQPTHENTTNIKDADGLPLPVSLVGQTSAKFLISSEEQKSRHRAMVRVCSNCHSSGYAESFISGFEDTVLDSDRMVRTATRLLQQAWKEGLADSSHPFDEPIEQTWVEQWLFQGSSIRYAAAMSGPDYATFKHGWWQLTRGLLKIREHVTRGRASEHSRAE